MLSEGLVVKRESGPPRPTLIYDADCGFCRRWIGRIQKWDRGKAVSYLPLKDPDAPEVAGRPFRDLTRAVHLARPDGSVFAGAAAAKELFAYLPGGWGLRGLMRLPGIMPLSAKIYAWVARRYGPVR